MESVVSSQSVSARIGSRPSPKYGKGKPSASCLGFIGMDPGHGLAKRSEDQSTSVAGSGNVCTGMKGGSAVAALDRHLARLGGAQIIGVHLVGRDPLDLPDRG